MNYLQCWIRVAKSLFSQALAGEPELVETGRGRPAGEGVCFGAHLDGGLGGRFLVTIESALMTLPILGEGMDPRPAWGELLREVAESAIGELLAKSGIAGTITDFRECVESPDEGIAFELRMNGHSYALWVVDAVRTGSEAAAQATMAEPRSDGAVNEADCRKAGNLNPGLELLLDVEIEAALRFGCREILLGELLDMGPGDVVELDRHIADPVDLIVGDKIVARGEVVLVNGNFGLRVTEVAAPRKRLETIRCLF